jgi:hypothetical protein
MYTTDLAFLQPSHVKPKHFFLTPKIVGSEKFQNWKFQNYCFDNFEFGMFHEPAVFDNTLKINHEMLWCQM